MKKETLKKANELNEKIKSLEVLIDDTINQKCNWIEFTFGNGSDKSTVCTDKDTIEVVRNLIFDNHIEKLTYFKEKLHDL